MFGCSLHDKDVLQFREMQGMNTIYHSNARAAWQQQKPLQAATSIEQAEHRTALIYNCTAPPIATARQPALLWSQNIIQKRIIGQLLWQTKVLFVWQLCLCRGNGAWQCKHIWDFRNTNPVWVNFSYNQKCAFWCLSHPNLNMSFQWFNPLFVSSAHWFKRINVGVTAKFVVIAIFKSADLSLSVIIYSNHD